MIHRLAALEKKHCQLLRFYPQRLRTERSAMDLKDNLLTMPLQKCIIHIHTDFVLARKPANVSFHGNGEEAGFSRLIQQEFGATLYPVHRLDHITSGLILFARHPQAARELSALFEEGEIAKFYLALSDGKPAKKQGWIKGGMEKARGGSWRLCRHGGLHAVTQFFSFGIREGLRLFIVRPRTGRTHQIRVALKSMACPILGDQRYGGTDCDRGYLHAFAIRFAWKDEVQSFILPPEEGTLFADPAIQIKLAELGEPWNMDWPEWKKPKLQAANND